MLDFPRSWPSTHQSVGSPGAEMSPRPNTWGRRLVHSFQGDDLGFVISAELVLVMTIAVLAMVAGLTPLRNAVVHELNDLSHAFGAVNQTYNVTGAMVWKFSGKPQASVWGFGYRDNGDIGDCQPVVDVIGIAAAPAAPPCPAAAVLPPCPPEPDASGTCPPQPARVCPAPCGCNSVSPSPAPCHPPCDCCQRIGRTPSPKAGAQVPRTPKRTPKKTEKHQHNKHGKARPSSGMPLVQPVPELQALPPVPATL